MRKIIGYEMPAQPSRFHQLPSQTGHSPAVGQRRYMAKKKLPLHEIDTHVDCFFF
ncbi:hypothetical protein FHS81_000388 [Pseudochelatococcus contaminans]|uniref:Uncharacterized protein n=2 Tax=Pseudochelatococcus contaminans TaxID=1538103 RepID=A0A7W5Z1N7_9HYPH|nr:hypothetical protein [Pseudochelatococcus contaminans]